MDEPDQHIDRDPPKLGQSGNHYHNDSDLTCHSQRWMTHMPYPYRESIVIHFALHAFGTCVVIYTASHGKYTAATVEPQCSLVPCIQARHHQLRHGEAEESTMQQLPYLSNHSSISRATTHVDGARCDFQAMPQLCFQAQDRNTTPTRCGTSCLVKEWDCI